MKVLLIHTGWPGCGCEWVSHYMRNALKTMEEITLIEAGVIHTQGNMTCSEKTIAIAQREKPDFAICSLAPQLTPEWADKINKVVPFVVWTTNDEMEFWMRKTITWSKHLTLYVSYTQHTLERHIEEGAKVMYVPLGCDELSFKKLDIPKVYDIGMFGAPHPQRKKICNVLAKHFLNNWFDWTLNQPIEYLNEKINQTRIQISPFMDCDQNTRNVRAWGLPCRTFDVPGTGTFLLQVPRLGLAKVFSGDELALCEFDEKYDFDGSINRWVDEIKYYLEHEKEREEIALRAYNRVMKEHLYRHRIQAIIDELKKMGVVK